MNKHDKSSAFGCGALLFCIEIFVAQVVFLTMKLSGAVDWSWWLVLSPALVAIGLPLLGLIVAMLVMLPGQVKKSYQKRKKIEAEAEQYGMARKPGETDGELAKRIVKRNMISGNYSRKDIKDILLETFPDLASCQFDINNQSNTIKLRVRKAPLIIGKQIQNQSFTAEELREILKEAIEYTPTQYRVAIENQEDDDHAEKGTV